MNDLFVTTLMRLPRVHFLLYLFLFINSLNASYRHETKATTVISRTGLQICTGFITIVNTEDLMFLNNSQRAITTRLRILSRSMARLNATAHVFIVHLPTVQNNLERSLTKYSGVQYSPAYKPVELPGLTYSLLDVPEALARCGIGAVSSFLLRQEGDHDHWALLSDVLRLCLAKRTRATFLELGAHLLLLDDPARYQRSFVATPLWHDYGAAMEVSNRAFCLSRAALDELLVRVVRRIEHGRKSYHPSELGGSMFTKVLLNRFRLRLLSANIPDQPLLVTLLYCTRTYAHELMLESAYLRRFWGEGYGVLVTALRRELRLPSVTGRVERGALAALEQAGGGPRAVGLDNALHSGNSSSRSAVLGKFSGGMNGTLWTMADDASLDLWHVLFLRPQ